MWSPNVAPNPTDQSRSNSISGVLMQISQFLFLYFGIIVKIKGNEYKKISQLQAMMAYGGYGCKGPYIPSLGT